jgi:hypothetical protein
VATTPEGKVKAVVRDLLHSYGIVPLSKAGAFPEDAKGCYYMPVQTGYGTKVLDFIGGYRGNRPEAVMFSIETKAPRKKPTPQQALQIDALRMSGVAVFVIDGDCGELEAWLRGGQNETSGLRRPGLY